MGKMGKLREETAEDVIRVRADCSEQLFVCFEAIIKEVRKLEEDLLEFSVAFKRLFLAIRMPFVKLYAALLQGKNCSLLSLSEV